MDKTNKLSEEMKNKSVQMQEENKELKMENELDRDMNCLQEKVSRIEQYSR